ncbi:MAG: septum site-determining protein MinC [Neisseria sp.]|nr:septum site-determining protein MinC [Neisseria sp.]
MKTAVEVKSARIHALALKPASADLSEISAFLEEKAAQYAELAQPVVLDCSAFDAPVDLDVAAVVELIRSKGLVLAALRHDNAAAWQAVAEACGVGVQSEGKQAEEIRPSEKTSGADTPIARPTVFVSTPIRTGQQVYAEGADLIVTGVVSEGAEIIADGNIHVYAAMRGRALAGADGRQDARIFIHSMQAELVSVAGIYRNFEQDLPEHLHKRAVQVYLQDDRLVVAAISD